MFRIWDLESTDLQDDAQTDVTILDSRLNMLQYWNKS